MTKEKQWRLQIGRRLAEIRVTKGLSKLQLANKVGLQLRSITRMEAGCYKVKTDTFFRITEALNHQLVFTDCKEKIVIINTMQGAAKPVQQ